VVVLPFWRFIVFICIYILGSEIEGVSFVYVFYIFNVNEQMEKIRNEESFYRFENCFFVGLYRLTKMI
jgi:hypothetical protein